MDLIVSRCVHEHFRVGIDKIRAKSGSCSKRHNFLGHLNSRRQLGTSAQFGSRWTALDANVATYMAGQRVGMILVLIWLSLGR